MTDTIELDLVEAPAEHRADVLARLRRHAQEIRNYNITALYLFGSAARDEMSPESDVDVFVDYERDGSFTFVEWVRLHAYLQKLVGRKVDFTSRAGLRAPVRSAIVQESYRVL